MPIEIRVMMYTDQEVVAALSGYFRRAGRPLTHPVLPRYRVHRRFSRRGDATGAVGAFGPARTGTLTPLGRLGRAQGRL